MFVAFSAEPWSTDMLDPIGQELGSRMSLLPKTLRCLVSHQRARRPRK
jgi:hypothetical protein